MYFRISLIALLVLGPFSAQASFFDGKDTLLCSVHQLYECSPPNGCASVTADEIGGVSQFEVDFGKKLITRAGQESPRKSVIKSVEANVDGKLIIQGAEDGRKDERDGAGWTISVMDPEGTMTLAAAGDGFAIVGLGACVPKP